MNDKNYKTLLINGCRQCGKTTTIQKVCNEYYKNVYYINLLSNNNKTYVQLLNSNPTIDTLLHTFKVGENNIYELDCVFSLKWFMCIRNQKFIKQKTSMSKINKQNINNILINFNKQINNEHFPIYLIFLMKYSIS